MKLNIGNAPGGNRTHNYSLGENCYIRLTTGTNIGIYIILQVENVIQTLPDLEAR